jgi:tetratricopeptide (TPR) repeat protein
MSGTVLGDKNYKAFISYSHADSRWAKRIHRYLESYRIPRRLAEGNPGFEQSGRRLGPVFRDRDELATASDLSEAAERALTGSEYLVVICSPRSAASRWVNEEVRTFKRLGRADRILCIIIDGEPNATDLPGREHEECFCPALRHRLAEDCESPGERVEPVAADARHHGDGWKLARQKLLAGLLNVGLDDLRQRELQRRNRRLAFISSAALAGMAITILLAITAVTARNDAERRREQADDLISFMLGTGKAMDYFAELPARDLDDGALAQRANALMQLGQVHMARGNLDEAMQAFSEALSALQELSGRKPDDPDRLFELGQAHFWVAYVHWEKDELDQATTGMEQYHVISERLYHTDPNNADYLLELGSAYTNLAILASRRGDRDAILDYSEQSVALNRDVLDREPGNDTYRRALADAYSWNGTLLFEDLQLEAAERRFSAYLDLSRQALDSDPEDSQWRDHIMLANRFTGDTALYQGRQDQAAAYYRDGIVAASELLEIEPENNLWQVEHTVLLHKQAQLHLFQQDSERVLAQLDHIDTLVSQRRLALPDDIQWKTIEADVRVSRAMALRLKDEASEAESEFAQAASDLKSLADAEPESDIVQVALARCLLEAGQSREVLDLFESGYLAPHSPQMLAMLVIAQREAGDPGAVASEHRALEEAGFRHPAFELSWRRVDD